MGLTSPHEHIKNTSICGKILTENYLETARKTFVQPGFRKDRHRIGQEEKRSHQVGTYAPWDGTQRKREITQGAIHPVE